MFWKAFSRTGCLTTRDGSRDERIRPHHTIKDDADLMQRFKAALATPTEIMRSNLYHAQVHDHDDGDPEQFITHLSDSESEPNDSEDIDDDEPEDDGGDGGDDGEREPLPHDDDDRFELIAVDSEATKIADARAQLGDDAEQLRDFNFAARVQREA